ncbi:MAG TPA: hypothetical protein DEQ61_20215 [Streptomyces sp.]|nr:hypothetical protein [Streptomyces sp.]
MAAPDAVAVQGHTARRPLPAGAPADVATADAAPASGFPTDGLRSLWSPRSVAVVGASDNPAKWGHWLASGALAGRARREVHLVNRSGAEVCGVRTVRSVRELAGPVDLTAVVVPAPGVERAVIDALEAGTRPCS